MIPVPRQRTGSDVLTRKTHSFSYQKQCFNHISRFRTAKVTYSCNQRRFSADLNMSKTKKLLPSEVEGCLWIHPISVGWIWHMTPSYLIDWDFSFVVSIDILPSLSVARSRVFWRSICKSNILKASKWVTSITEACIIDDTRNEKGERQISTDHKLCKIVSRCRRWFIQHLLAHTSTNVIKNCFIFGR